MMHYLDVVGGLVMSKFTGNASSLSHDFSFLVEIQSLIKLSQTFVYLNFNCCKFLQNSDNKHEAGEIIQHVFVCKNIWRLQGWSIRVKYFHRFITNIFIFRLTCSLINTFCFLFFLINIFSLIMSEISHLLLLLKNFFLFYFSIIFQSL